MISALALLTTNVSVSNANAEITSRQNGKVVYPDYVKIKSITTFNSMGAKSFSVALDEKLVIEVKFETVKELLKLQGLKDSDIAKMNTITLEQDEDDETVIHLLCDETEFLRVDTESFLKDTDSVKEVLLKLDENGLTVSHDDKEIDKTEITLTTAAAVSMADGKLKLEEVKD